MLLGPLRPGPPSVCLVRPSAHIAHARSLAYSRISLADVAQRLHLSSPEDAASIVAKVGELPAHDEPNPSCMVSLCSQAAAGTQAIRDGAIDAMVDAEAGAMVSRDSQVL